MPEEWVCLRCGKKYQFSEPESFGNYHGQLYCCNCYEDMLDEAEERRIQRIQQEQEQEQEYI